MLCYKKSAIICCCSVASLRSGVLRTDSCLVRSVSHSSIHPFLDTSLYAGLRPGPLFLCVDCLRQCGDSLRSLVGSRLGRKLPLEPPDRSKLRWYWGTFGPRGLRPWSPCPRSSDFGDRGWEPTVPQPPFPSYDLMSVVTSFLLPFGRTQGREVSEP